ncbi:hypothetical protein [Candidatus Magnetomonas plexicatena]|uniref:hypothetical protein n=1 Tax=Candidatus Magnetomonas plexicatena TaxID=2552947 RepID=UPI001C7561EC|nr:hypothetical protein E2O03_006700 [Nitrospirales bacterium LBB_01]
MVYEYINDYLYFVLKPYNGTDREGWLYCSGVNVSRFIPLTQRKHRFAQNPAVKGLQSANLNVISFAIMRGAKPVLTKPRYCDGIIPVSPDMWRTEVLLIENATQAFLNELFEFTVKEFLRLSLPLCFPDLKLPEEFLPPDKLQSYFESLM